MNKNILVIGGAGYIGSSCVNDLVNSGYEVVVLDNLSTGQMEKVHKNARITHGNILDLHFLEQVFIEDGFDTVIHLAAKKSVNESEENPELYFQNNVVGTLNILSMMSKYNVPKIIFSSTAAVYKPKNVENAIYTEDSEVEPINVYGRTKYMCELMIKDFQRLGKIKQYVIFRYFNVAGDTGLKFVEKNAQNVFPLLSNAIVNGTEFTIFGDDYLTEDGTGVRDYIHISDLANAHVLAVQADTSAVYNLGTKNGYSVKDLVKAFEDITGNKMNVKISKRRKGDPAVVVADPTLVHQNLNWQAKHNLHDMVLSTLDAFGSNTV